MFVKINTVAHNRNNLSQLKNFFVLKCKLKKECPLLKQTNKQKQQQKTKQIK